MYPYHYISLFPPFPRTNQAFVAMSFATEFETRWEHVIRPALSQVRVNEEALEPFRVDLSRKSDAILTEILEAIASCRVVFADVTKIGHLGEKALRNANVLYEVGIAHASRLPGEVVIFRSDHDRLDFDIQGVRVHDYDPDTSTSAAVETVRNVVVDSLNGLEASQRAAVTHAAQSLTADASTQLLQLQANGPFRPAEAVVVPFRSRAAISALLSINAIQLSLRTAENEELKLADFESHCEYTITPFGEAVANQVRRQLFSGG